MTSPSPNKRFAPALIVLLALCLALWGCVKNPVSGEDEFSLMTVDQELAHGKELYPRYTQQNNGLPADDAGLQVYVNRVGGWLAKNSHRSDVPWAFNVVNTSDVNAYALPGGKISITRGLITRMRNEDELAYVLGHEIGHVAARHSAAQYTKGVMVSVVVAGVAVALSDSDYRELGAMAASAGGMLLLASYSRDQERQADSLGMEYMARAGYNPQAAVDVQLLFLKMQKGEPGVVETLLASHPLTTERIQNARDELKIKYGWATGRAYRQPPFNQALAKQKSRQQAYAAMDKGDELFQEKQFGPASDQYRQASRMLPQEGLFQSRMAQVALKTKQNDQALAYAKRAVALRPDLYETYYVLGVAYQINGAPDKALIAHQTAERLLPTAGNRFMLGLCYDKQGQSDKAAAVYKEVQRMDPKGRFGQMSAQRLKQLR